MIDLRLRSTIPDHYTEKMLGKLLTDRERSLTLCGAATVRKPNGQLLCIYLPGALRAETTVAWDALSSIREQTTNRGYAGGAPTYPRPGVGKQGRRTGAKVKSALIGAFDQNSGVMAGTCRLTSFTVHNIPKVEAITPVLRRMDELFREHVGDRYEAQAEYAARTHEEWLIPGTVYTTITVNNTYATGVHTDKGDLDAGFSCLAVARRGPLAGGVLTFPKYSIGVDLQDGDLLLMDAHEMHGNTPLRCGACGADLFWPDHRCAELGDAPSPERVSLVGYYRTKVARCARADEEREKRLAKIARRNQKNIGIA